MFSKISRYRKLPDVSAPDAGGTVRAAKDLRLLPTVSGTFRHTVNGGDRLDHLAYKYYGQPLQWWAICDANPEFLSPLAPLGQEPVVTTLFPVTVSDPPPWSRLFQRVDAMTGVENVHVVEDFELVAQQVDFKGQPVTVVGERATRAVLVTYNRMNATAAAIAAAIQAAGFDVAPFTELGQVGQQIVIPPKPIG
jgi:phage tail protein X